MHDDAGAGLAVVDQLHGSGRAEIRWRVQFEGLGGHGADVQRFLQGLGV